ncbi:MAG: SPOR domain-containing protein [Gemmatimonadaceae bacterium]
MWETAGARVSASLDHASSVAVLGDDPAATGAVALGIARVHATHRRVFLCDLLGDGHQGALSNGARDDFHGVSDMVHYGVSLARVAHAQPGMPNLFIISGGAESPLTDEVLAHPWWETLVDQVSRAGALLLVAAPSLAPSLPTLAARFDGVLLVGDAIAPVTGGRVLGQVRGAAPIRTPPATPRSAGARRLAKRPARRGWLIAVVLLAALAAGAYFTTATWAPYVGLESLFGGGDPAVNAALPSVTPSVATERPPAGEASYSVELHFTNSRADALEYVLQKADSLPAATFDQPSQGNETDRWYRLLAGAFGDSASAQEYLDSLRARGTVGERAGAIAWTPYALLLDSASSDEVASAQVAAYRGRGIPAYILRDSTGTWRVYAGAFAAGNDARSFKQHLDSLNIQSVLATRTGSTP